MMVSGTRRLRYDTNCYVLEVERELTRGKRKGEKDWFFEGYYTTLRAGVLAAYDRGVGELSKSATDLADFAGKLPELQHEMATRVAKALEEKS